MKSLRNTWPRTLFDRFFLLLATGLGVGYLPPMPGTYGSLAGVILAYFTLSLSHWGKVFIFLFLLFSGLISAHRTCLLFKERDPDQVIIDEIVGAYFAVFVAQELWEFAIFFVLFRVIDILKPPPIGELEKLKGGLGIMMDDVLAGFLTALGLFFIIIFKKKILGW